MNQTGGGGGGGNEERNGLSITILVPVPITSPITTHITARSGAWPLSGSGPRSWPSKGTFVLQIDFPTVIIINYYSPCYILTYVAFGTIMLSLQILIWTVKSISQNVTDFLHDFIKFYYITATFYKAKVQTDNHRLLKKLLGQQLSSFQGSKLRYCAL